MFSPLKRTETVPEQIASILQRAILSGELSEGERLPSEKMLAAQFETNRVSLRQALQILKANGFIEGGQGKAWKVADYRKSGGLQWLPALFEARGFTAETVSIVTDFLAIRTPVLEQILSLAMLRMTEQQREELEDAMVQLEHLVRVDAPSEEIFLADLFWFETLLEVSDSLLFRSVYQPFSDIYKKFSSAVSTVWTPPPNYPQALRSIQDLMQTGSTQQARTILRVYLEEEAERLYGLLQDVLSFMPISTEHTSLSMHIHTDNTQ